MAMDEEIRQIFTKEFPEEFLPRWDASSFRQRESLMYGFREFSWVVFTLILRETRTRYGRHKLGYLWAFTEPILHLLLFLLLFYFLKRESLFGMSSLLFLTTGMATFFLFMNTYSQVASAIIINKILMAHSKITALSIVISRAILEFATMVIVIIFLISICYGFLDDYYVENFLSVIISLFGASILGLGLGMVVGGISPIFESFKIFVGISTRFLYFTSGIFFTIEMLPTELHKFLLWNPLLHFVENIRKNLSPLVAGSEVDLIYALAIAFGLFFAGLVLQTVFLRQMLSR